MGVPTSSQFPNLHALVGVNGADAAAQGPVRTLGGISYVETAYAKNVGLPVASVVNEAGNGVQPTPANAAQALQGATLNADLTENLSGVFDNTAVDAYPVSFYSYFVDPLQPITGGSRGTAHDVLGGRRCLDDQRRQRCRTGAVHCLRRVPRSVPGGSPRLRASQSAIG